MESLAQINSFFYKLCLLWSISCVYHILTQQQKINYYSFVYFAIENRMIYWSSKEVASYGNIMENIIILYSN